MRLARGTFATHIRVNAYLNEALESASVRYASTMCARPPETKVVAKAYGAAPGRIPQTTVAWAASASVLAISSE